MNLPKHIPVGNSDAGAYFNTLVLGAIEYGVSYLLGIIALGYMIRLHLFLDGKRTPVVR